MTAPTNENPRAVPAAPREPKGNTVGGASATSPEAPQVRGYAPPIIDTVPPPSSAAVPQLELPRLWLSFHSDGKALYCSGSLQREHIQRVHFDPSDPIVGQAYAFFVRQIVLMLDGGSPLASVAPPAEESAAHASDPESKTPPIGGTTVQRLESGPASEGSQNPEKPPA
jgi:hypothetical protein